MPDQEPNPPQTPSDHAGTQQERSQGLTPADLRIVAAVPVVCTVARESLLWAADEIDRLRAERLNERPASIEIETTKGKA